MVVRTRSTNKRHDTRDARSEDSPEVSSQAGGDGAAAELGDREVLSLSGSSESGAEVGSTLEPEPASGESTPTKRSRVLRVDKLPKSTRVRGTYDSTEEIEFRTMQLAKRLNCDKADLVRVLLVRGIEGFKSDERARRAFALLHREDAEAA
jgi:hypothetical protein